jgi:hypothetical protein
VKTTSLFLVLAFFVLAASAADSPAIEATKRFLGPRAIRPTGKNDGIVAYIPRKDPPQQAATKLAGVLPAMAARDRALVVGGPDTRLARDVVRIAFSQYPARSLHGLTVVCALPRELAKPLERIVTRTGAKFFVIAPEL